MAIRVVEQFAQSKLFISFIYYYFFFLKFYFDISFHTEILQFPLRRISPVNHR